MDQQELNLIKIKKLAKTLLIDRSYNKVAILMQADIVFTNIFCILTVNLSYLFVVLFNLCLIFNTLIFYKQTLQNFVLLFASESMKLSINQMERHHSRMMGSMNSMLYLQYPNQFKEKRQYSLGISDNLFQIADQQSFDSQINISSWFAWGMLFLSVICSAFVPCWLMGDVKSQPLTRNSWRFLTLSILLIPFMMYEQRNVKDYNQKLWNVLTKENLQKIFVCTVNYGLWLLAVVYACKSTSMNHVVCLAGLRFLLISLHKFKKKQPYHEFQIGGSMLALIGITLVVTDSLLLPQEFDNSSEIYLRNSPWRRFLLGDCLAFVASIISYVLDRNINIPHIPRFTYAYLYNLSLSFCLVTFGYFFEGSQFSFNVKYGIFGLFTYENFVNVFYVSIMLGLNLMIANIFVAQIFSKLMINISSCFELIITTMIYHILQLQLIPSGMTCLGFSFIIPGLIVLIAGQGALTNQQNKINLQLYKPQIEARITKSRQTKRQMSSSSPKLLGSPNILSRGKISQIKPFETIEQQQQLFDLMQYKDRQDKLKNQEIMGRIQYKNSGNKQKD